MQPLSIARLSQDPRVTVRRRGDPDVEGDAVIYWMQRAQRAVDNPALDTAIALGNALHRPVVVFFGLNPFVERANLRHYQFLADGLRDLASGLRQRRVGFVLRRYPEHRLLPFLTEIRPAIVVGDENPLRQMAQWREKIAEDIGVPFWTVDADVVIPTRSLEKEQYAARTIRPRIHRLLPEFLMPGPEAAARVQWQTRPSIRTTNLHGILDGLCIDATVSPARGFCGGTTAGRARLRTFVDDHLNDYDTARNQPDRDGTSQLSPYLHFGHLGPREVALAIQSSGADQASITAFIEQLIVRRELAVNFVHFNDAYDRLDGCERWARQTLRQHQFDARPHRYTTDEFEAGATHDALWNAAQAQMINAGWMHGYVRMYWAKKILEWSGSAEEAFAIAVELNDRYLLDGRDPNGYTNIAWAIGGKHDRPWPPRPVYGTIRSMSAASTSRKFNAAAYIAQHGRR